MFLNKRSFLFLVENKEIEEAKKRLSIIRNENKYQCSDEVLPLVAPQETQILNSKPSFNSVYSNFKAAISSSAITTFQEKGVFPDSFGLTKVI